MDNDTPPTIDYIEKLLYKHTRIAFMAQTFPVKKQPLYYDGNPLGEICEIIIDDVEAGKLRRTGFAFTLNIEDAEKGYFDLYVLDTSINGVCFVHSFTPTGIMGAADFVRHCMSNGISRLI